MPDPTPDPTVLPDARAREAWNITRPCGGKFWDELPEDLRRSINLTMVAGPPPASDAAVPAGGRCGASPDHSDIMETIANASDDWHTKGYTSALAEVRDMANVGRGLMEALPESYSYMQCPSEIVSDLQNDLADALAAAPKVASEGGAGLRKRMVALTEKVATQFSRYISKADQEEAKAILAALATDATDGATGGTTAASGEVDAALEQAARVAETVNLYDGDQLVNSDPRKTIAAAIRALSARNALTEGQQS